MVLTPAATGIVIGHTAQLTAVAKDASGNTIANAPMSWLSLDTLVARVSATGLVTGVAVGTTFVIATSGAKADTSGIGVMPVPVAAVSISPSSVSLVTAATLQLAATITDSAGNVLSGQTVTWTTSSSAVATVSATGLVTGVAPGTVTITAASGGKTATLTASITGGRVGYYVATNGSSSASGSISAPWTLTTALAGGNGKVKAGDTIWVRGGTYRGSFRSSLQGVSGKSIVVRAYPGEKVVIDGGGTPPSTSILRVGGDWSAFWGLEILNSDPTRTVSFTGNGGRSNTIANYASHTKFINLVVHDGGVGFYNETSAYDIEIAGCLFYNNGWQAPDRGHGHALYLKSDVGPILVRDNVIFNQFGFGVHAYTMAGSGKLSNIRIEGNVAFNNGTLATNSLSSNILLGGDDYATGDVVRDNLTYFSPGIQVSNVKVGYGTLKNGTLQVQGNYMVGGGPVLEVGYWSSASVSSNTLVGSSYVLTLNERTTSGKTLTANLYQRDPSASAWRYAGSTYTFSGWRSATGLASGDLAMSSAPAVPKVITRANPWEGARGTIVVYNWSRQGSVLADVSGILNPGDSYVLRNVQNLNGSPIASGTFNGGAVSLPLSGVTPPAPLGMSSSRAPRTGPDFDVFVISRY